MVAALWSNSNYDDGKNTRQDAIAKIESSYNDAIEKIDAIVNHPFSQRDEGEEIDKDNPFFAAAERGMRKLEERYGDEIRAREGMEEVDYMKGLDQE